MKSEYQVDLWREVRRRWMVGGVLAAVAAAVLAPRAPRGKHRYVAYSQYVWLLPLGYIYFAAGRRGVWRAEGAEGVAGRLRLVAVSCAHAALVAPALAVLLLAPAARSHVHLALVHGMVISSVGSGCGWLSLALCEEAAAAPLTAAVGLVSLLTTPLAMLLLCGRGAVAAPGAAWGAGGAALAAWGAGVARWRWRGAGTGAGEGEARRGVAARLCALALVFAQCRDALATRGSVRLADLLGVLLLEVCWLALSGAACWGYARCGLLAPQQARTVALCALPRAAPLGWQWRGACAGSALARLPPVLLAPAQALLLAALDAPPDPPRAPHAPRPLLARDAMP